MVDDLPARIADKVAVDDESGCWNWTASLYVNGYGRVRWDGGVRRAHRVVYNLLADSTVPIGGIRGGDLVLDHIACDNRRCVNPAHLQLTTQRENLSRHGGSSGFVGVSWYPRDQRWHARIKTGATRCHLGFHDDESFAAEVYDAAAFILAGERPNHQSGRLAHPPTEGAERIARRKLKQRATP